MYKLLGLIIFLLIGISVIVLVEEELQKKK